MDRYKKNVGDMGEDAAERHLRKNGYAILERNFYIRGGELDIIASKGGITVFTEVKTRTTGEFGTPAESVTYHKMRRMKKAAAIYMMRRGESYARFDVIEVYARFDAGQLTVEKINHIENAFM